MKVWANSDQPEGWSIVAYRAGRWISVTPEIFPMSGTREEAQDRIRLKVGQSIELRTKFNGWWFYPVRFDDGIQVHQNLSRMSKSL